MIMPKLQRKAKNPLVNLIGIIIAFIVLVVLCQSGVVNAYISGILMTICISIIMATSLNIATGFLGQLALGHCGFMAIGAYTAALITKAMANSDILVGAGVPNFFRFIIAILIGGALAALFGMLVGIPALKLKGDYLAIITLGFGEIIRVVIQNLKFCGGNGLSKGAAGQALVGINRIANIYVVFWITVICVFLMFCFVRSRYGRALKAIREDDVSSGAAGLNVTHYKVLAFTFSAFFAGIAGGIFAHYIGSLSINNFTFMKSVEYVIMVVFGGMSSLTGSIVAGGILSALPEALRKFATYRMLVYSIALVVVVIFKPTGLFGTREFCLTNVLRRFFGKKETNLVSEAKDGESDE